MAVSVMGFFSPQLATSANLELSPRARAFFSMNWISPAAIGQVLMEAAKECTGPSGVFAQHFNQGQSQWPAQSESWKNDPRKAGSPGAGKKFFQSGQTFAAITQDIKGGVSAFFGSSADVYSDSAKKIQFTSKGLFVRVSSTARGASLIIGFAGRLKQSAGFKAGVKSLRFGGDKAPVRTTKELESRLGRKIKGPKFKLAGSIGFTGTRGKSRFISVGKNNLGYANILQTGEFKGFRVGNKLMSPQQAGYLKRTGRKKLIPDSSQIVRGSKMPLLPAKPADARRLTMAIERGVLMSLQRSGVTRMAA